MALNDIYSVITWWGYLVLISIIFYPLTRRLFSSWIDDGYVFAKTIGILLTTYTVLLLGFLHLASLSRIMVLCVLVFYALLFLKENVQIKNKSIFLRFISVQSLRKKWKVIVIEELLILAGIFFISYIRSFSPDIHGLEKYMDFGFMNSILRGGTFPPKDMWLTPFSINYYYFGHFYSAVLIRLTGIRPEISYNLILATVFALTFSGVFSLAGNLYAVFTEKYTFRFKTFLAGLLSAALVTLAGNLHIIYAFFSPYENEHPVPPTSLAFAPFNFPNSYWYPNATRFIHNTIHEFPMYSWIVADLHGHVLDMPFVILTVALLFSILHKSQKNVDMVNMKMPGVLHFIFVGFLLAVMYMTNAWDGLIYLLLAGCIIAIITFIDVCSVKTHTLRNIIDTLLKRQFLIPTITMCLTVFISFIVFSLPFSLYFKPFVSGIGVLTAPSILLQKTGNGYDHRDALAKILTPDHCKTIMSASDKSKVTTTYLESKIGPFLFEPDHCLRSPLWQLVILYGFFLFFAVLFLVLLTKVRKKTPADLFILALIALGAILIIIPEFIYVKDIYPDHYRANTMFKLVFQSFMLLSIVSGYTIVRFISGRKDYAKNRFSKILFAALLLLIAILLSLVFTYPFLGIPAYYGNLQTNTGLNGIQYLKNQYPDDYAAIMWLNQNVSGHPVILEAQGDSYTDYARVSANTGLPTVLGWTVHEWLWRGSYDILPAGQIADPNKIYDVPAPRIPEIQTLYETTDPAVAQRLLKKYKIAYVFVGNLEYEKYPNLDESKFQQLGKTVFQKGKTKVYKISG